MYSGVRRATVKLYCTSMSSQVCVVLLCVLFITSASCHERSSLALDLATVRTGLINIDNLFKNICSNEDCMECFKKAMNLTCDEKGYDINTDFIASTKKCMEVHNMREEFNTCKYVFNPTSPFLVEELLQDTSELYKCDYQAVPHYRDIMKIDLNLPQYQTEGLFLCLVTMSKDINVVACKSSSKVKDFTFTRAPQECLKRRSEGATAPAQQTERESANVSFSQEGKRHDTRSWFPPNYKPVPWSGDKAINNVTTETKVVSTGNHLVNTSVLTDFDASWERSFRTITGRQFLRALAIETYIPTYVEMIKNRQEDIQKIAKRIFRQGYRGYTYTNAVTTKSTPVTKVLRTPKASVLGANYRIPSSNFQDPQNQDSISILSKLCVEIQGCNSLTVKTALAAIVSKTLNFTPVRVPQN